MVHVPSESASQRNCSKTRLKPIDIFIWFGHLVSWNFGHFQDSESWLLAHAVQYTYPKWNLQIYNILIKRIKKHIFFQFYFHFIENKGGHENHSHQAIFALETCLSIPLIHPVPYYLPPWKGSTQVYAFLTFYSILK